MIVRCSGVADVVEAVRFAREHPMPVSIRGGGHQVAGSAVCDDGIVIDLSTMNGVHVDPVARTAGSQAGARWADVDRVTQLFGLATTGGEVSITGVAGLTLGGGHGAHPPRLRPGLRQPAVDRDRHRRRRRAHRQPSRAPRPVLGGPRRRPGIRVVTSFEFDLHPLGPEVAVAQVAYDADDAKCLRAWRELASVAPDAMSPKHSFGSSRPTPPYRGDYTTE